MGPATLRPDGQLVAFSGNSLGQNALFNTLTNTWSHPAGMDFPLVTGQTNHFSVKDGPAVTLPNGNVLVMAAPVDNVANNFLAPSHFWEVDLATNTLTQVADSPNAAAFASFDGHFMMLPSGEALFVAFNQAATQDVDVYSNGGAPQNAWRPTIASSPATIVQGSNNNPVSGTLFNGLSQGAAYGDDSQSFTNYPLVRITNNASGHVVYARTHSHNRMGVEALGSTEVASTQFDAPANLETGPCTLAVVTNGIASPPATCTVANQAGRRGLRGGPQLPGRRSRPGPERDGRAGRRQQQRHRDHAPQPRQPERRHHQPGGGLDPAPVGGDGQRPVGQHRQQGRRRDGHRNHRTAPSTCRRCRRCPHFRRRPWGRSPSTAERYPRRRALTFRGPSTAARWCLRRGTTSSSPSPSTRPGPSGPRRPRGSSCRTR